MTTEPVDARLMYLAGLWEGEGCASVCKGKHPSSRIGYGHYASLTVRMTDPDPVKVIRDYFGGSIYISKQYEDTNTRATYAWAISGRDASDVAKQLIPYILIPRKRGALQCVIDFAKTITNSGRPLSPETLQQREDLHQKCKAFNAKGINANNRDEEALVAIGAYKTDTAQLSLWAQ